jgi:hypothetical protein
MSDLQDVSRAVEEGVYDQVILFLFRRTHAGFVCEKLMVNIPEFFTHQLLAKMNPTHVIQLVSFALEATQTEEKTRRLPCSLNDMKARPEDASHNGGRSVYQTLKKSYHRGVKQRLLLTMASPSGRVGTSSALRKLPREMIRMLATFI